MPCTAQARKWALLVGSPMGSYTEGRLEFLQAELFKAHAAIDEASLAMDKAKKDHYVACKQAREIEEAIKSFKAQLNAGGGEKK